MKNTAIFSWLILCFMICGAATAHAADTLLYSSNFSYVGSFRVPLSTCSSCTATFVSAPGQIGYDPQNNGLLMVSHNGTMVGEISIPTNPANTSTISNLPTAQWLSPNNNTPYFWDPTAGNLQNNASGGAANSNPVTIGGIIGWNGKLLATGVAVYDGNYDDYYSHFTHDITLSDSSYSGYYHLSTGISGVNANFLNGYMAPIPSAYQTELGGTMLTGNCLLNIITGTSFGPSVGAFDPSNLSLTSDTHVNQLIAYPSAHQTLMAWNTTQPASNYVTIADKITGIAFPDNSKSILFFGYHGEGANCYGDSPSTCYDPYDSTHGVHAYPYISYVWAYNVDDLAAVKAGTKNPWDVKPYAMWRLKSPYSDENNTWGATYNPNTNDIYISRIGQDPNGTPIIDVYHLNTSASEPTITIMSSIPSTVSTDTPSFTFTSDANGTLTYGGSCLSSDTSAVAGLPNTNTITLNPLSDGTYSNCTVTLTDSYGNVSNTLAIPSFTVEANPGGYCSMAGSFTERY